MAVKNLAPATSAKRRFNLSIFGRTFLLMLAALMIAEGIGIVLILKRPPVHNRPVSLSELAQRLDGREPSFHDRPSFEPSGPPPGMGPNFSMRGPPPSSPQQGGPDDTSELHSYMADAPPLPLTDIDGAASGRACQRLAMTMHVNADSLRIYIKKTHHFFAMPQPGNDDLGDEGFIAAHQLDNGAWRIIERAAQTFPTAFQKQAMLLFAAGLLCLLPLAWLFSRALSIPIANFSQAAKRIGADPHASPLSVEGPTEMLAAIESFNAMQARLNGLLQERTEMIAAIAHDLRTPLTRLAFRLDDLPSPLNEKVSADIQEMKSMISAALDFIRDRTLSTRRERLDFRLLVESVVDDQTDLDRAVTLARGAAITVLGDPLALRRAVMNVVDNAIKYGERAQLQLSVSREECRLEVDDEGPGIAENVQQRVFEPFFRLESSRNRDTGGVGLGLAVVRAIVLDHGGSIQLRNRAGKGLRVTITLPITND